MLKATLQKIKAKYKSYTYHKYSSEQLENLAVKAIMAGNLPEIKYLYPQFLNPNDKFSVAFYKELTPLFLASQQGKIEIINFLLSLNVDINQVDANGRNALMLAILFSSLKDQNATCYSLINCNINLSHRDMDQKPAICYVFRSKDPLGLVQRMISNGYDAFKEQIDKNSNLFDFMFSMHSSAVKSRHDKRLGPTQEICSYLISSFMTLSDCEKQYNKIKSKKHYASSQVKEELIAKIEKNLISLSIPLNSFNEFGASNSKKISHKI